MNHRFGTLMLVGLLGCGEDALKNAKPNGTIQGEIRDGITSAPIDGATISIVIDGVAETATTDITGWFVLDGVPAGSTYTADVSATGYATARVSVTVDDAAGEHPQSNSIATLLLSLFSNGHSLDVYIFDEDGLAPVPGILVTARNGGNCGGGNILGVLQATTDAVGVATLTGLATRQSYQITTVPTEVYHSGFTDAGGGGRTYGACFTQGEDPDSVDLIVTPLSCDGSPDPDCVWWDPGGFGMDADTTCQCDGCSWDDDC